jgi:DNA-directed RNA polymerase subunit N
MPVRCFSCGKLVAHKWDEYAKRLGKGEKASDVLTDIGFSKYCCRRMFISQPAVFEDVKHYPR